MFIKYENRLICEKCGGKCCKQSGCYYEPKDIKDWSLKGLLEELLKGDISIVSNLIFEEYPNGKEYIEIFLSLRARNKNRPIVDLLSMRTTCASLTDTGCKYEFKKRPSGGKNLIPRKNGKCHYLMHPNLIKTWYGYQEILQEAVKKLTGKSVEDCLKSDVQNLFSDYYLRNFDNVCESEIEGISILLPTLARFFPEELRIAQEMHGNMIIKEKIKQAPRNEK